MYLGVDIGGTKTLLAVFTKDGALKQTVKFKTPVLYDDFRDELQKAISELHTKKFNLCCVAIPGKVDRANKIGVAFGNLPWMNVPIGSDVKNVVNCEVILENDGNLAGLYESRQAPEFRKAIYLTVSTGIGSVLVVDGKIQESTQDAEVGHMLFEHDGKLMRWEEFASGTAIVKKFGKLASEIDADDSSTWYIISHNIAIGLIDVIATQTPDVVIFGGGVGAHFDKFKDRLLEDLKIYENPLLTIPVIIKATHPEEAVVYGCYEMAKDANEESTS